MGKKELFFLVLAVGLSLVAARHRWDDTAHSMALITAREGIVRHPPEFDGSGGRYTLITSLAVLPPYRGDARLALEGKPTLAYEVYASEPALDLHLRRTPRLEGDLLRDLQPRDSVTLWLVIKPPSVDPVCGMPQEAGFLTAEHQGRTVHFCSESCRQAFLAEPDVYREAAGLSGEYTLALYDARTDRSLLKMPVTFGGKGEGGHAHQH